MQSLSKSGTVSWPLRILSPWLVATLGGLCIGTALLNVDRTDFPAGYRDGANRAASYESPPPALSDFSSGDKTDFAEEAYEPSRDMSGTDSKSDSAVSFSDSSARIELTSGTVSASDAASR